MSQTMTETGSSLLAHRSEQTIVIEPRKKLLDLDLKAIWEYRELLYFLVWRDLKVRYRQTVIGIGWVVLQPLLTMILFTIIFGRLAKIPSEGVPYPIFAYAALLPWTLFASSLTRGGQSVVADAHLVSKIYFPRLILPLCGILSPMVDFAISLAIFIPMMIWFGILPGWGVVALPAFLLFLLFTALAVGLWLSALNVSYRDVGHTIPFLVQIWMFASPVAYPVSLVPKNWRMLYGLNPMAGVIEGFRWALLGKESPDFALIGMSIGMVLALLIPGLIYFKYTERTFADVV